MITLTAVNDLRYNRFEVGKSLVIAPKKVAEDTQPEAGKMGPSETASDYPRLGSREKRIKGPNTPEMSCAEPG